MNQARKIEPLMVKHFVNGRFVRGYRLAGNGAFIGSSRNALIRIPSDAIAGVVAYIDKDKNSWQIKDMGSQPDLKIDGKPFVEHRVDSKGVLQIGKHTFAFEEMKSPSKLFNYPEKRSGSAEWIPLRVVKLKGQVIEVLDSNDDATTYSMSGNKDVQVVNYLMPRMEKITNKGLDIDEELKKPVLWTIIGFCLMIIVFFGLSRALPPELEKPKDNMYTRMIYDSKILTERKKALTGFGKRTKTGTGNGNGSISEGEKGQTAPLPKAVVSLRKSGLQSIIGRIAVRASQNAKLIAVMAGNQTQQPQTSERNLGTGNFSGPSAEAIKGTGLGGNGKGYKVGGIGTGGKGAGVGGYKAGTGLGTGAVGNGQVALEDEESVVEGGLDKDVIAGVIKSHLGQIRYCYERQLSAQADLHGKVKVRFTIDGGGAVDSQSVSQSTLNSAMVEECILRRIAGWKFPKPKGGTKVIVSYPFLFKSVN